MAVKKSKLKSSLPKASTIRWCAAGGTSRYENIVCDNEYRAYSRRICFKQPSLSKTANYSWQIVYRWRGRYVPSQKAKTTWTKWTNWKTPTSVTLRDTSGTKVARTAGDTVATKLSDCDYWRRGNRSWVTSGTYNIFINWTGDNAKKMNIKYDKLEFDIAIRSYNSTTGQHGSWVRNSLYVKRKATVVDEVLVGTASGGFQIDFNYISERGGNISVTSIKDSNGKELMKNSEFKASVVTDTARQSSGTLDWYPYKRSGYTAGHRNIPASELKRKVSFKEKLTVTAYFITPDGAKTKFAFRSDGYVYGEAAKDAIPIPRMTFTLNKNNGLVTVKAYKTDDFTGTTYAGVKLTSISAHGIYKDYDEKTGEETNVTLESYYDKRTDMTVGAANLPDLLGTWYFRPPMNKEVTYRCSVRNEYNQWNGAQAKIKTFEGSGCHFCGVPGTSTAGIYAALSFNTSLDKSTTTESKIELPYGRDLPFAVYGTGRTSTMNLKGYSVGGIDQINKYASPYYIKKFAKHLGVYFMRTSKGEIFKVAVKSVDYEYVTHEKEMLSVTITMEEVS